MSLSEKQEPKYSFFDSMVVNRASGEPIPFDEPIFIFRARDRHAIQVLEAYALMCHDIVHFQAVLARVDDFRRFAKEHPDRMKEPDTQKAVDGK